MAPPPHSDPLHRVTKTFDVLPANSLQMNSDLEIRVNQARVVAFVPCSPPIFLFFNEILISPCHVLRHENHTKEMFIAKTLHNQASNSLQVYIRIRKIMLQNFTVKSL